MEDRAIIELYWARQEQALVETDRKYGAYCRTIARNILKNSADSEECVNDTYLRAWNTIPPQRPAILQVFLGTITRNLSVNRYRAAHTLKRGSGQLPVALEELEFCLPASQSVEQQMESAELGRLIDGFLRGLPERDRYIFIRRYWYVDSVREIARRLRMSEGTVKSNLFRTRQRLKEMLAREGVEP
jgi:RNA polymerase sigma-70 factor (ECF subfamily)